jgi:predicted nucleotidyltransferase
MTTMARARIVIWRWAARHPEIVRVYLFGSRIRGRSKLGASVAKHSDLDVAVEFRELDEQLGFQLWMDVAEPWRRELEPRIPWSVDLEWYHSTGTPRVCRHVADCHKVVYPCAFSERRRSWPVAIARRLVCAQIPPSNHPCGQLPQV